VVFPTVPKEKGMKKAMVALLIIGLWACNQASSPEDTDVDHTQMADSGATPGANTTVGDTPAPGSGAAIDSVQLDSLNKTDKQ
jgi:hypothetical protein